MRITRNTTRRIDQQGDKAATNLSSVPCRSTPDRRAFTLIELLVTMAIILVLAGLVLGVAANALTTGRVSRTKSIVARIHTLLSEHYDSYRTRRAEVSDFELTRINANSSDPRARGLELARARLFAKRELMMCEMPDRWSDVWLAAVDSGEDPVRFANDIRDNGLIGRGRFLSGGGGSVFGGPTPLNEAYRREFYRIATGGASMSDILANQGAECLYMTVMFATGDGEARSLFAEQFIDDTDGDGAYEFIDGWGNPIEFLRWAPGVESPLQENANELVLLGANVAAQRIAADRDPFDLFGSDPDAYRLVPYIFSAGVDGRYGVFSARNTLIWNANGVDPFQKFTANEGVAVTGFLGTPVVAEDPNQSAGDAVINTDESADNITNHLITAE